MLSNSLKYCQQLAAPEGSDFYYCLRKVKAPQRNAALAIEALFQSLYTIPFTVKEDAVASVKLQWWHQEIERAYQGQAQHPITLALQEILVDFPIPKKQLLALVENIQQLLQYALFQSFEDLTVFIIQTYGLKELIIANCFDNNAISYQEAIYQASLCLALTDQLKNCRLHLKKSFVFFSETELAKFKITRHDLFALKTTPPIEKLFEAQYQKAIIAAKKTLPPKQRLLQLRCKLASKWLNLIKEENFCVLEKSISVTPIRKLLTTLF